MTTPLNPFGISYSDLQELEGLPSWAYGKVESLEVSNSSEDHPTSAVLPCTSCSFPVLPGVGEGDVRQRVCLHLYIFDAASAGSSRLPLWMDRRHRVQYYLWLGQCPGCRRIYWILEAL